MSFVSCPSLLQKRLNISVSIEMFRQWYGLLLHTFAVVQGSPVLFLEVPTVFARMHLSLTSNCGIFAATQTIEYENKTALTEEIKLNLTKHWMKIPSLYTVTKNGFYTPILWLAEFKYCICIYSYIISNAVILGFHFDRKIWGLSILTRGFQGLLSKPIIFPSFGNCNTAA